MDTTTPADPASPAGQQADAPARSPRESPGYPAPTGRRDMIGKSAALARHWASLRQKTGWRPGSLLRIPVSCMCADCEYNTRDMHKSTDERSGLGRAGSTAPLRRALQGWRWLPPETTPDAAVLLAARGVRAFGDGFVSVLLPVYLLSLGLGGLEIGGLSTATLLGSAALTLLVGLVAHRFKVRPLLVGAALLMAATGAGFALLHDFWPLLIVAFVGTLNPSSGDVSVFLPLEQSVLPQTVSPAQRTALFARYSLIGSLVAAAGSLCAGLPELLAARTALTPTQALQGMFLLYGLLGLISLVLYNRLSPATGGDAPGTCAAARVAAHGLHVCRPLQPRFVRRRLRRPVAPGPVALPALRPLGRHSRHHLLLDGGLLRWLVPGRGAARQRFGLVNTMVFTHLPSNVLLLLVPFMPNLALAILLLLVRSALSQMDVPTRNSYVMAVVPPAERAAAASVTSVPRSLATAASPLLSGYLLGLSTFGWPLVIAGALKGIYDVLLLAMFAKVKPPEETLLTGPMTVRILLVVLVVLDVGRHALAVAQARARGALAWRLVFELGLAVRVQGVVQRPRQQQLLVVVRHG